MPETRGEWTVFAIGALAIAALVALIVLQSATDRLEAREPAVTARVSVAATTQAASATSAATSTEAQTTAEAPAATSTAIAKLTLSALADTWVEVRSGSAGGDVLYSGILPQGTAKHFRSPHLWASFGAAANLTARLNGKFVRLPPGTYSARVGPHGVKPLLG